MIDDHDRCEWVNVPSGTGSSGLSRTRSCKMVVVEAVDTISSLDAVVRTVLNHVYL